MSGEVSDAEQATWIADTGFIRNFLLVDRMDILFRLAGGRLFVPPQVLHPEDLRDVAPAPLGPVSELGRGLWLYRRRQNDPNLDERNREITAWRLKRFESLSHLLQRNVLQIVEFEDPELMLFAQLQERRFYKALGVNRLGAGEAACLAIAISRNWVLATDDSDALRALESLAPGHPYRRTRQVLELAISKGILDREQARALHHIMVHEHNFWDQGSLS